MKKKYIYFIDDISKFFIEEFEGDEEKTLEEAMSFGRKLYELYQKPVSFYHLKDENKVVITKEPANEKA